MIDHGWIEQPGGLYLAVPRFNKENTDHRDAAATILSEIVQTVAQAHGTGTDQASVRNNMRALYARDIKLDFYIAKWDLCEQKPILVGGALSWDTVGINNDGRPSRAMYTEDVCIMPRQLRVLARARPKHKQFPDASLAARFERIGLGSMASQEGAFYRFGEVSPENTKMMAALGQNAASIGVDDGSKVLELKTVPEDLMDRWPVNVQVIPLRRDGVRDTRNFIVRYREGDHDIRFIATKGRATAVGETRSDIRTWHNGNLPKSRILENVVSSALLAMKYESLERKWGSQRFVRPSLSPSLPLLGSRGEAYRSLFSVCTGEFSGEGRERVSSFTPPSDNHIHIQGDQAMIEAFTALGARPRVFGNKPMMPGINILR